MTKGTLIIVFLLAVFNCTANKPQHLSHVDPDSLSNKTEVLPLTRLAHIRSLFNKYPAIELPFTYTSQSGISVTEFDAQNEIDTLVFGKDAPCGIIGIIPDSTNYFGFFYLAAYDDPTPSLVTYDKSGNLINQNNLSESCWQGCESDCNSFLEIDEKLNIQLRYEYYEFEFEDDDSFCAEYPNFASGYIRYSHIDSLGNLIYDKQETIPFEALMKNPIIHNFD